MAINLPGLLMQEPILSLECISGSEVKLISLSFEIISKFKCSGFKSLICVLKSLILPSASNAAGFSFPLCPTLNNFIILLKY